MTNEQWSPEKKWTEAGEQQVRDIYVPAKRWIEGLFKVQLDSIEAVRLRDIIRERIIPVLDYQEEQRKRIVDFWDSLEKKYGERWFEREEDIRPFWREVIVPRMLSKMQDPVLEAFWAFINEVWGIDYEEIRNSVNRLEKDQSAEKKAAIEDRFIRLIQDLRIENRGFPEKREK